ncbi:MAG: D-alanine--D-alanine ligase [Candidatus Pacebacteria bacterium]|nr:D-alanine--D-alanine ligase [Candidatus Paceibacterota bacterium]
MEHNKTIGVFFGSRSTEHDISIITAQLIISGLKGLALSVVPVYINREGYWLINEELGKLENFTDPQREIGKENAYKQYYLDLENSIGKIVFKKKGLSGKTIIIDLAFPAFHGAFGEDGTIQGLFEMLNVPYVGCDVTSSAIAMDKALTKQMCQIHNIPTTKFIYFYKKEWEENKEAILNKIKGELSWPVFVKPVHLGSSIGIAKVKDKDIKELENKIEVAFYYDNKVLIEEEVANLMDVTCCIIGNEKLQASLLQESVFKADLFDFEEKYLKEGGGQFGKSQSSVIIPARINQNLTNKIQEAAKEVYKALGCSGIARVDFLLNKANNEFFANEVNPLPGTLYHHLWKESGMEFPELLKKLVSFAGERHSQKQNFNYSFQSSVLNSINSKKLKFKKS